jgi:hypothetical protein
MRSRKTQSFDQTAQENDRFTYTHSHLNERLTELYKHFIEHLRCMNKEATQIKVGCGKKMLDRAAVGTWPLWHGS